MKKLLMFALSIIISGNTFAGEGWALDKTIFELETHYNGTEVKLSGHSSGACNETIEGGTAITVTIIGINQANKEQLMSVLLTAFATGRNIDVYCAAATGSELRHIRVRP